MRATYIRTCHRTEKKKIEKFICSLCACQTRQDDVVNVVGEVGTAWSIIQNICIQEFATCFFTRFITSVCPWALRLLVWISQQPY